MVSLVMRRLEDPNGRSCSRPLESVTTFTDTGGGQSEPERPTEPTAPTPRDQWPIPGVYFDTTGWRLTASSATCMTWAGDQSGELTLTMETPSAVRTPRPINLDAIEALRQE